MGNLCCIDFFWGGSETREDNKQKSRLLMSEKEFCKHCGAVLSTGSFRVVRYCSQCGSSVRGSSVAPPEIIERVRRETEERPEMFSPPSRASTNNNKPNKIPPPVPNRSSRPQTTSQSQSDTRPESLQPQINAPQSTQPPRPNPKPSQYQPPPYTATTAFNYTSTSVMKPKVRQTIQTSNPSGAEELIQQKKKKIFEKNHKTTPPNSSRQQDLPQFLNEKEYDGYKIVNTK